MKQAFPFCLVSGFRPLGGLHIGHYGAVIKDIVELQYVRPHAACVFIADHHARTEWRGDIDVGFSHIELRSIRLAKQLVALGVDPTFTQIYRQSDVPAVFELLWLLAGIASDGELQRGHAYAQSESPTVGTYLYPLLMVADILGMKATNVAIGRDQSRHLSVTRDIAERLANCFGEPIVPVPEGIRPKLETVRGTKSDSKMDTLANNAIGIFDSDETINRTIARILTDPVERGAPLSVDNCRILEYAQAMGDGPARSGLVLKYADPTFRYRHAKHELKTIFYETFSTARSRVQAIHCDDVRDWFAQGAVQARQRMEILLSELRSALCVSAH